MDAGHFPARSKGGFRGMAYIERPDARRFVLRERQGKGRWNYIPQR